LIDKKFKKFFQNINFEDLLNSKSLFIIASWILSIGFLFYSLDGQPDWAVFWLFVVAYFWVQTNRILFSTLKPPTELVLLLLFCIISLDIIIVSNYLNEDKTLIINLLHSVFLTVGLLLTGILLVANSQKNSGNSNFNNKIQQRVLIWYGLIGYAAHTIVFYDHTYFLYGFLIILFLVLLKKTTWLESLSKSDLWISFVFILILFFVLPGDYELRDLTSKQISPNAYWISLPYYLYLILKMYLLVTLVKIPVVMIYNHATLSRKLSIAGLFQSSFPQFIQFLILLFTFYFFIASWQGDQLRSIINSKIQSIINNQKTDKFTYYKFEKNPDSINITLKGYRDLNIKTDKTELDIISLNK